MRRLLLLLLLAGCDAAPADSGVAAWLRLDGAQFDPGPPPVAAGGPAVAGAIVDQNFVVRGSIANPLHGTLAPGATAAIVALDGDAGYWIVVAGVPDVTAPDQPTFTTRFSLAPETPLGDRDLLVRAADADGRIGSATKVKLTVVDRLPAVGALVVTLRWDTESDLDLHVVEPSGFEIWARDAIDYQPPQGMAPDPVAMANAGQLDADSNAGCVIDGRREEDAIWKASPPSGHYLVRVDLPSLCGASFANWSLQVLLDGATLAGATGYSDAAATRGTHQRGSGLLALAFDVP